jgi:hypothetical protein
MVVTLTGKYYIFFKLFTTINPIYKIGIQNVHYTIYIGTDDFNNSNNIFIFNNCTFVFVNKINYFVKTKC